MTRDNPITRAQGIIKILRNYPEGASLEQISADMTPPPSNRRALQRWLLELIEQGRVVRTGKARACRYCLPDSGKKGDHWVYASEAEYLVPSKNSGKNSGIHTGMVYGKKARVPMDALLHLLEAYNPNTSFYLDEQLRTHLHAIGTPQHAAHQHPENPQGSTLEPNGMLSACWIDLAWNSSRLEGNAYTLPEAEALLASGYWAKDRSTRDGQMLLNQREAIDFLINSSVDSLSDSTNNSNRGSTNELDLNIENDNFTLYNLHALLADNLIKAKPTQPGEAFHLFLSKTNRIEDPFEKSFFTWLHLSHLQVFECFNDPVARLMANLPLLLNKLWPLTFLDVPQKLYSEALLNTHQPFQIAALRDFFVWAYTRSCKRYESIGNSAYLPDAFKIQHRQTISSLILKAVQKKTRLSDSAQWVQDFARQSLPKEDWARFSEIVLQELAELQEGNIARYKISRAEFKDWEKINSASDGLVKMGSATE